jgi:hypothetical protein
MKVLDLNTAEGTIEHFRTLPTENLRNIAAREVWAGNAMEVAVAAAILIERGE